MDWVVYNAESDGGFNACTELGLCPALVPWTVPAWLDHTHGTASISENMPVTACCCCVYSLHMVTAARVGFIVDYIYIMVAIYFAIYKRKTKLHNVKPVKKCLVSEPSGVMHFNVVLSYHSRPSGCAD